MEKSIVAIVGRPNVGKSTLFNRLCHKKSAIVDFEAGVTRDRKYEEVEWNGRVFLLVDTGGILPASEEPMDKLIKMQADLAIEEADLIVFLVDGHTGTVPDDKEIARILYPHREKVILAANKVDNEKLELDVYDFLQLGFGDAFPIAAVNGRNTGNFLDYLLNHLPTLPEKDPLPDSSIKVAIVGKPNVGKSSIVNKLMGTEQVIVSDVAGTTRDAIDSHLNYMGKKITLIDTAGLRRKAKISYGVEYFSTMRSIEAVNRADVVILVLDANQAISQQDKKIAAYAHRKYKDIIVVYNKWDLIKKDTKTIKEFQLTLEEEMPFLEFAPVLFMSVAHNQRVHKLFEYILKVEEESQKRVPTSQLNQFLERAIARNALSHATGKYLKIYYCVQKGVHPPTFIFFCNNPTQINKNYRRYLHNKLREEFKFEGATIKLYFRGRTEDDPTLVEF